TRSPTGTTSPPKKPLSVLAAARWCDWSAYSSISERVIPHLSASTCATQNWMPSVLFVCARNSGANGPTPPLAFDDIGARVIDSTPHAIAQSYAPAITPCATKCTACCEEPHCRSTDVAGTVHGSPAATQALRVTLQPCSPAWVTQPPTTSSTSAGSKSLRSTIVRSTRPRRSVGCHSASAPLRFPKAERAQSTITASRVAMSLMLEGDDLDEQRHWPLVLTRVIARSRSVAEYPRAVRIAVLVKQVP